MKTILMVDDNPLLLELYGEMLSPDYHVMTAQSVASAIQLLKDEQIDAVGCDYHLGDGCGLQIVEWIASHRPELLAKTAIISGEGNPPMHGYDVTILFKPVSGDELIEVVDSWFAEPAEEH